MDISCKNEGSHEVGQLSLTVLYRGRTCWVLTDITIVCDGNFEIEILSAPKYNSRKGKN